MTLPERVINVLELPPKEALVTLAKRARTLDRGPGVLCVDGGRDALRACLPSITRPDVEGHKEVVLDISTGNDYLWGDIDVSPDGRVHGDLFVNAGRFVEAIDARLIARQVGKSTELLLVGNAPFWAYALVLARACQAGCGKVMWTYRSQQFQA